MRGPDPSTVVFDITFAQPIDLPASLRPLGRSGDDGLDRWDGTRLVRTVRPNGAVVPYAARVAGAGGEPRLEVTVVRAMAGAAAPEALKAISATFVSDAASLAELAAGDPRVARLVRIYPGVVPVLIPDPFSALIRSISAQQVNLRWAATIRRRLADRFGTRHEVDGAFVYSLHAPPLAAASIDELRALQLTTAKSSAVIDSARAAQAGELDAAHLATLDDEALIAHLTRLRGIGRWSAEWFLARTLGRPRVVAGDLGVRKAIGRLYGTAGVPSEAEVRRLTEHWGRGATMAQALALHDLADALEGPSLARRPRERRSSRPVACGGRPGTGR